MHRMNGLEMPTEQLLSCEPFKFWKLIDLLQCSMQEMRFEN